MSVSNKTTQNEGGLEEHDIKNTTNSMGSQRQPQFLPKLLNQKIMVRMFDGRPIQGILEGYNNYELKLGLGRDKKLILFKGAISSIEYEEKVE